MELWRELKEWRKHWNPRKFLVGLIFGLATSLFDFGADFNFAWSVPEDCQNTTATATDLQSFDKVFVSSPCGLLYYKNVERTTFTYIVFPGFFLGFSSTQGLVKGLVSRCIPCELHVIVRGMGRAFAVALEVSLAACLLFAAMWSDVWERTHPHLAPAYDNTIQGMAILSAILILGVKSLGVICHGPETRRLVFQATKDETIFEASTQLGLVMRIFMSSGIGSSASYLSALSSIVVIGKVGIQNFLNRHEEKLSNASLLGKVCVAASVLPVFVLTAVFKIGAPASNHVWNETTKMLLIFVGLVTVILTGLITIFLKNRNQLKDLTWANLNQGIMAEFLVFHLWPKDRIGRKLGVAITSVAFLVYALPLPLVIADPKPKTPWTSESDNNDFNGTLESRHYHYEDYESETGKRLQIASIFFLASIISIIFFENEWVAQIVTQFPNNSRREDSASDESLAGKGEIDLQNPERRNSTNMDKEDGNADGD